MDEALKPLPPRFPASREKPRLDAAGSCPNLPPLRSEGALRWEGGAGARYVQLASLPAGSDQDPLNLVEGDLVARAVVELGRARRLVGSDRLGVFDGAAVAEVGGEPFSTMPCTGAGSHSDALSPPSRLS